MDAITGLLVGLVVAIVALVVFTFVFMWIWNLVMPDVFGVKQITPWQALGILILASILFGGHRVVNIYPHAFHHRGAGPTPL
jgi:hypothetical protein